eukprot:TRINITY_DN102298_c0_g1_i1.p1 TRINITY_DN102298_c0_g1~~TRINITY_DN102298_c0_g1_i1.p1  ORF type:complete len:153 (+),score=17.64 TRINITY_DN102298_c0_g1_i1:96-554(+)
MCWGVFYSNVTRPIKELWNRERGSTKEYICFFGTLIFAALLALAGAVVLILGLDLLPAVEGDQNMVIAGAVCLGLGVCTPVLCLLRALCGSSTFRAWLRRSYDWFWWWIGTHNYACGGPRVIDATGSGKPKVIDATFGTYAGDTGAPPPAAV